MSMLVHGLASYLDKNNRQYAHFVDGGITDNLLIIFYTQQKRWDEAYVHAERLARLYPDAPGPRRTLEQIKALREFGVTTPINPDLSNQ